MLCLDFGTAMSKAFAIDGETEKPFDLAVGQRSGYTEAIYALPSSLFISGTGRVYLGHEAIAQSLLDETPGRQRFDSPKQELSQGTTADLSSVPVPKAINPTEIPFTKEELITLYLGYLTDMACTELQEGHERSRYVRRRFARPCWDTQRTAWAEQLLERMLSRAQILADTFSGHWQGGIDVRAIRAVFDKLGSVTPPTFLIAGGVEEPVAAAASIVLQGERQYPGFLVVDVGAGTTDFGLFVVIQPRSSSTPKIFRLQGSIHGIRQAGDTIDNFLRAIILKKHHVDLQSPYGVRIGAELNLHIRRYKEALFRDGTLAYRLADDTPGSVSLPEFLDSPEVARFSKGLREAVQKTFDGVHESWIRRMFEQPGVLVVLTGGGARLPMVHELTQGWIETHGIRVLCHAAPSVPTWITEGYPEFIDEFPQLAVAMGGAAPELPEMGPDTPQFGGLSSPTYVASNLQVKGV
ncbi:MAG: hypothetical protein DPW12_10600 [Rhodocyclaceae bacterium]|nr:hypothetical protein [Bacteroidia bacterium]MCQ3924628.1 hypothetical protein [Rhodocyclaceae bacterium]